MRLHLVLILVIAACSSSNGKKLPPGCDTNPDDPKCNPPQCMNAIDDDGDGLIDYPADPGCFSPNQDNEVDDCQSGPNCPECANGKDDDGNGVTDFSGQDPGCYAASDTDEYTLDPSACGASNQIEMLPWNNEVMGSFAGGSSGM